MYKKNVIRPRYMMTSIVLVFLISMTTSGVSTANSSSQKAKAYHFKAQEYFDNRRYDDALEALEKAKSLLGESKPRIAALENEILKAMLNRPQSKMTSSFPEMVTIPSGSFQMGSNNGDDDEKPVHRVTINAFRMSKTEVTFAQWDACVAAGSCSHKPDKGWGRENRPVINVSYNDISKEYLPWLSKVTGQKYRLPSESEWEYAARAGSSAKYSWGNAIDCSKARYGYLSDECGKQKNTDPVGSFNANAYGLYDMHGNVWEWTQDCWNDSYSNAYSNNRTNLQGDCGRRVLRGGSWISKPFNLRSTLRSIHTVSFRNYIFGFRVVSSVQG